MPHSTHLRMCGYAGMAWTDIYYAVHSESVYRMCAYVGKERAGLCSAVHSEFGVQKVKDTSLFGFVNFIILQSQNTGILLQSLPL